MALGSALGARKASKELVKSADAQGRLQQGIFEENKERLNPWYEQGTSALEQLAATYGPNADFSAFTNSPDYQFAQEQGQQGLEQQLAARGLSGGGGALKSLARFNQGLATQQLGNYRSGLNNLTQMGQSAASQMVNNGWNYATQGANSLQAGADARAAGALNMGSAMGQALQMATPFLGGGIGALAGMAGGMFGGGGGQGGMLGMGSQPPSAATSGRYGVYR